MIFKNKGKLLKAAEKFVLQGRFEQAIAQYVKVIEDDPNDLSTLNIIGDLFTRLGQNQEAIRYYSRVAEQYRTFNYLPKAIAMYKKMELLAPRNMDIAMTLADLYSEEGLKAQAKKQYQQVVSRIQAQGNPEQAVAVLQKIVKLEPDNPEVLSTLGRIYAQSNDVLNAERYLLDAGEAHLRNGARNLARPLFLHVLALNHAHAEALRGLLDSSDTAAELAEALQCAELHWGDRQEDAVARQLVGLAYLRLGRLDEAEPILRRLAAEDEDRYFRNLVPLAEKLVQAGRLDAAVEQVAGISAALITRRELPSGIAVLERVLENDPKHFASLSLMADLYIKANQEALAGPALERLVQALQDSDRCPEALEVAERLYELGSCTDSQRALHRRVFEVCFPGKAYLSPAQKKVLRLEEQARLQGANVAAVTDPASRDHTMEFSMLLRYGMLEKARTLLLELLAKNPDDAWAKEQLAALEREIEATSDRAQKPLRGPGIRESGALTMPGWMQEDGAESPVGESASDFTDESETGTAPDNGPVSVPRSVFAPPEPTTGERTRQSGSGPRSLDFAAPEVGGTVKELVTDDGSADSPATESLKETLSEAEIIAAVESFFDQVPESEKDRSPADAAPSDPVREVRGNFEALLEEGQARFEIGMVRGAITAFRQAMDMVSRYPHSESYIRCCTFLGNCHMQLGEAQSAVEWFRRPFEGLGLNQDQALALRYELARAYEMLGDTPAAKGELEQILKVNPAYRDSRRRLHRLEEASR